MTTARTSDVSVLGLGAMGGAIARALLAAGKSVTVWNRSGDKARALVAAGGRHADCAASAFRASPVALLTVTDADAVADVINSADDAALAERVVVFLGSATPRQTEALAERIEAAGGRCLAGTIMAYPREIGLADAAIIYSGRHAAFEAARDLLTLLAGRALHVGEGAGRAKMVSWPLYIQFFTAVSGFFEGAALARTMGMSGAEYARWIVSTLGPFYARHIADLGRRLDEADYDGGQASIDIEAHSADAMVDLLDASGVDSLTTGAYRTYLQRAKNAGLNRQSVAAAAAMVAAAAKDRR